MQVSWSCRTMKWDRKEQSVVQCTDKSTDSTSNALERVIRRGIVNTLCSNCNLQITSWSLKCKLFRVEKWNTEWIHKSSLKYKEFGVVGPWSGKGRNIVWCSVQINVKTLRASAVERSYGAALWRHYVYWKVRNILKTFLKTSFFFCEIQQKTKGNTLQKLVKFR